MSAKIDVLIPALNESTSIGKVLAELPMRQLRSVVVVDNGSTDETAAIAQAKGAIVIVEPQRGYGAACLRGIRHLATDPPDILVFIDADYSDHPDELPLLTRPILADRADLVIGSRVLGKREPGALLPQARFGNALSTWLIRLIWGVPMTDLGPFRAIRWDALMELRMEDEDFGWTVEMQVKAARRGLRYMEVPVSYRKRVGKSKITGTVRGTVAAGTKILWTIFRYALKRPHRREPS